MNKNKGFVIFIVLAVIGFLILKEMKNFKEKLNNFNPFASNTNNEFKCGTEYISQQENTAIESQ